MLIKRFLPKSLFGRALLILVIPTVLIQMGMAYMFYERHWQAVTRYMSNALAGDTAFLVNQLSQTASKTKTIQEFETATSLDVQLLPGKSLKRIKGEREFEFFERILSQKISEPFVLKRLPDGDSIELTIQMQGQLLVITTTSKRLESPTTTVFLIWMVVSSTLLLLVATIFLRNQLRPISRLAQASDAFGRGVDTPDFRPSGASEVRMASRAFITMRERIKRQIRTRTDMLSGISHDLRTPLTRMKLQLAMLGDSDASREMGEDVAQMEHMIAEYLDFARGEGGEEAVPIRLDKLLSDIVVDYGRIGTVVHLENGEPLELALRPMAFRRTLTNLIDNAIRYGKTAHLSYARERSLVKIMVDDEGKGIPPELHEEVFRPFARLDASRNSKTGGVGLGLTIARDIVLAHGGSIQFAESPFGGLRVIIILPLGKS